MMQKVRPGQKIGRRSFKAADFNALADLVNATTQQGAGGADLTRFNFDTVTIQNNSGGDLDRFDILGIDTVAITPTNNLRSFQEQFVLVGVTPVFNTHWHRIAVLQQPIADGAYGKAVISRPTVVQVNVTIEGDMTCGIDNSDATRLTSSGPIPILWKESGTGEKWAIVDLGRLQGTLPVTLTQTGGSDGDDTTIATWTYTATSLEGDTLYTGLDILSTSSPVVYAAGHKFRRPELGSITPATFGTLYLTGLTSPRWGLLWCNEVPAVEAC